MNSVQQQDVNQIIEDLGDLWGTLDGKRVLVTGASGMVGQYLVYAMAEHAQRANNGLHVIALMRNPEKGEALFAGQFAAGTVTALYEDVTSVTPEAVGDVDYIMHAASPAAPQHFKNDPVGIIHANVLGTWKLLEVASKHDAVFCLVSTMEVYGEIASDEPIVNVTEASYGALDSLSLRSAYPESKRMAETSCIAYGSQHSIKTVIARLGHTYGPGMLLTDGRVQADFMRKALGGEKIILLSDGSARRTSTYISDAVSGLLRAVLHPSEGGETYNISNMHAEVSIRELAEFILQSAGRDTADLEYAQPDPNAMWSKSTGKIFVNSEKLEGIGWKPRYGIEAGIARTIAFHQEELSK